MNLRFRQQQLDNLTKNIKTKKIRQIVEKHGSPIMLIDKQQLQSRYSALINALPRVTPHFAIKSCPMSEVLSIYKEMGVHLDVATNGEIEILKSIGYPPELTIHTHPHKRPEDIKQAFDFGIRSFVFDSVEELDKLEDRKADVNLTLRLSFPNRHALIDLSYKFGLTPKEALDALGQTIERGFNVTGVCFHVGSQLANAQPFKQALLDTKEFMDKAKSLYDHNFLTLDIGGGFPSQYMQEVMPIEDFAKAINPLLDKHFADIEILCEPGRYLVNDSIYNISQVTSAVTRLGKNWLYINDGVYGSFSDMLSGHMNYILYGLSELDGVKPEKTYIVGGPTCDSIDIIDKSAPLPNMKVGDLLITPNMGAYAHALTSNFNSIPTPKAVVI